MRFFSNYKLTKLSRYLLVAGVASIYLLGFAARVYSPAHIGRYAVPVPRLIPVRRTLPVNSTAPKTAAVTSPTQSSALPDTSLSFSHSGITTTYFWVGERADADNGYIANAASAWDGQWQQHYGGEDTPSPRNGFTPAGFTPKENPFYFALPYNDISNNGQRKSTATNCPLASSKTVYSWCKNSWIAIRHNGKVVYAQWEDVGPFQEDDTAYVFGSAAPKNRHDAKAGLDVSPAVRDYLSLSDVDKTDWVFVDVSRVPDGPWKRIPTTTNGTTIN